MADWPSLKAALLSVGLGREALLVAVFSVFLLETVQYWNARFGSVINWISNQAAVFRWGVYYALAAFIFFFGVFQSRQFIYFQF